MELTAEQRIKRHILIQAKMDNNIPDDDWDQDDMLAITDGSAIDELWDELADDLQDYIYEFRSSGDEIIGGRNAPWSRHYECDSVGVKLSDGVWVGWNYWHGGGKHGEPEAVEWLSEAYILEIESTVTIERHIFKKV